MEKEKQIEHPKQYWETIRELEIKMFPEFQKDTIYAPENSSYFYFAPSWHIRSGLVTEANIKDFQSDNSKKLLSVGSGNAFLEKLLVRLGIKKENIVLSDNNAKDLPKDFESKVFDMDEQWTGLGNEKYDLIIFPESANFNSKFQGDKQNQNYLHHLIIQSLNFLKPNGIIRIDGHCQSDYRIDAVIDKLKSEGRKIKITYTDRVIEVKNETSSNTE